MADVGDNNFMRYVYRGEEGEIIPREATHITIFEGVIFVRTQAFLRHPNIIEVICHENVKKIERDAFFDCKFLRRVIMPGVKEVELGAFMNCFALTDVECGKLETIKIEAFGDCTSLRSINLPSARTFAQFAFDGCTALTSVKFGSNLGTIEKKAFGSCKSLEQITLPLKDLITADDVFAGCDNLKRVDFVEAAKLHEVVAALHLEEWRNDMHGEIDSINRILPNAPAGSGWDDDEDNGEKTLTIRTWIRSVLGKMNHYQEEHERLLREEVEPTLKLALPHDIVMNNVFPFLELPSHRS